MAETSKNIVVAGAGSIGCYAGGCLALAGRTVTLLGRPRLEAATRQAGLRVSDLDGRDRQLGPVGLAVTSDPVLALGSADIVLVTAKSGGTQEMGQLIAKHAPATAVIVSLQNGTANADRLRGMLPGRTVLAGMVPFNVVQSKEGELPFHVRRASEGTVLIGTGAPGLAEMLNVDGFAVATHEDMPAILWGKLLLNLNNALVALSGLPLAPQLSQRAWRLILADQIAEALAAMKAAGVEPARIGGLRPAHLPAVLRLPDWLFKVLARRMLAIDPQARSSMWEDLQRRRPTEIDELQGAILRLAARSGTQAPIIGRIASLIRSAEQAGQGSPGLPAEAVTGMPAPRSA